MKNYEVHCNFSIYDFTCTPDEVTNKLGIAPTKSWNKGDVLPGTKMMKPTSGWQLSSRIADSGRVGDYVEDLIVQLRPIKDRLRGLGQGRTPVIICAIYLHSDATPSIHLNGRLVQEVADIGAEFGVDLYNLAGTPD